MGKHTLACIFQVIAICASIFGVIVGILQMIMEAILVISAIRNVFAIVFCLFLLCIELYIFSFFKYFGFILKMWGKGLMYLLVGALFFQTKGIGLGAAIVFWVLAVVFGILSYFLPVASLPAFQGGVCGKPPPSITITAEEVYEKDSDSGK